MELKTGLNNVAILSIVIAICLLLAGCSSSDDLVSETVGDTEPTREEAIPADAVKVTPDTDLYPPVVHSASWADPIPMPGPVNTAGAEDAPVISADGTIFIFFFTPDANLPAEDQVVDGVSGIWWCTWDGSNWTDPVRAYIFDRDETHLDGPFAVQQNTLWFGSIRSGNYGLIDIFTAELSGGEWTNWQNAGTQLNLDYDIGELYLTEDGNELYYGSTTGGNGQTDLWLTTRSGQTWSAPVNLGAPVNTAGDESRPFISSDGTELWFTRAVSTMGYPGPAVFRSVKSGQAWSDPEEIVSNYVGDPGLDEDRNLYFTHVFYDAEGHKIEADIYVAYHQ